MSVNFKKLKTRNLESETKTTRRMKDLPLGGGKGDGTWNTVEEWFESDDAEFSYPFTLVESFEYLDESKRPKYGFGLLMEDSDDETKYYIAVPGADSKGKVHQERQKLFQLLQDDSTPITGCVLQRVDTGKDHPFIRFISVEAMERIIENESESEDD